MAQTFDIRFARSAGLAAMLEVPENAFRWKGGGLLRIDAQGVSISLKRGLLALLGGKRTHRIPTENLRAVYREGDALRVEFQDGKTARVVLPFWARDRDAAAQIVQLLPTSQTVEIENETRSAKPRADWRMLLSSGAALAAIVAGSWAISQRAQLSLPAASAPMDVLAESEFPLRAPASAENATQVETPARARRGASLADSSEAPLDPSPASSRTLIQPIEIPMPSMDTAETTATPGTQPLEAAPDREQDSPTRVAIATPDGIVPIEIGTPRHAAAQAQLIRFKVESNALRRHFMSVRYPLTAESLHRLDGLWEKVTIRISNEPAFEDPELKALLEIELAISRAWRRAFSMYADPAMLVSADAEVDFAEMLTDRAEELVE